MIYLKMWGKVNKIGMKENLSSCKRPDIPGAILRLYFLRCNLAKLRQMMEMVFLVSRLRLDRRDVIPLVSNVGRLNNRYAQVRVYSI